MGLLGLAVLAGISRVIAWISDPKFRKPERQESHKGEWSWERRKKTTKSVTIGSP
jgi:hypothetical protein